MKKRKKISALETQSGLKKPYLSKVILTIFIIKSMTVNILRSNPTNDVTLNLAHVRAPQPNPTVAEDIFALLRLLQVPVTSVMAPDMFKLQGEL